MLNLFVGAPNAPGSLLSRRGQLEARDLYQREGAATRLGLLGPYAIDSAPALSRILANESNDARLRTAAATALGLIGPAADGAVPSLIAALEDDDPQLSRAALVALQRIGPQTRTIPALLEAMRGRRSRGAGAGSGVDSELCQGTTAILAAGASAVRCPCAS